MSECDFLQEHECTLSNQTPYIVEEYLINNKRGWYFNANNKLYAVKYCPYCGEKLGEDTEDFSMANWLIDDVDLDSNYLYIKLSRDKLYMPQTKTKADLMKWIMENCRDTDKFIK